MTSAQGDFRILQAFADMVDAEAKTDGLSSPSVLPRGRRAELVRGFIRLLRLGLEPRPGDGPSAAAGLPSLEIDTLKVRTLEVESLRVRNPPNEDEK